MKPLKRQANKRAAGIVILGVLLLFFSIKCKSPSSPDENRTSNVVAFNDCGAAVDIYMDGAFQFSVEWGSSATILTVSQGSHSLEAMLAETQTLVQSQTIEITLGNDALFTVHGPSTISVTNQYGEILKIYLDETYLGDIGNNITQTVRRIRFGSYNLEAKKKNDETAVASTRIEVVDIKDYAWVITQ